MTVVGITGAAGFFGWHLRCRLHTFGWEYELADRSTFAESERLDDFVSKSDVVVHLAGVNRASTDEEIRSGNIDLAQNLADARTRTGASFDVVYANTVKADDTGAYGEAKAQAAEILARSARGAGDRFVDIRFPHLFGEFGVPNYNSGVTTFAHQLATGSPSQVNDGELDLLHVQDASQLIMDAVTKQADETLRPEGRPISVVDCYEILSRMADSYVEKGTVPLLEDDLFELRLFNTLRSQMWPLAYPMPLTKHADHRGAFFEVVRACGQGQTSISTTVPGVRRGEHYHLDKIERFAVISGEAMIRVRRLFTDEVVEFQVSGDEPVFIDMPPLCTHDITNTGSAELVTLFWSHDHFNPANSDTYPLQVTGEELPA